ncbi:hypothetical protein P5673_004821 [Acropora cervicornis]|uniref:Uncharacterized protein n=1 Tax=Acropora cervicornis TaxID=6130 RepID=A0AAD9VD44_ACRCE|nr:hypothetical protein P5673_004821 [Acropora cervicornis]
MGRSRSYYPTIPLKHVTPRMKLKQLSQLRHVLFPEVERQNVSILIGTSLQEAFIPLEVKKGKSNEPFAIRSCLGWSILSGSVSVSNVPLNQQLEEFWRIQSCGTVKENCDPMSLEDRKALKIIDKMICIRWAFSEGERTSHSREHSQNPVFKP